MILLLLKSIQQGLFDAPVHVAGSVDKHGVIRAPHVRIQKVAIKKPKHVETSPHTPDMFDQPSTPSIPDIKTENAASSSGVEESLTASTGTATGKWFGSQEKADAYLDKKKLRDSHVVVPAGRRFEIHHAPTGVVSTGDKLNDYWANSAGASIQRKKPKVIDTTKPKKAAEPTAVAVAADYSVPFSVASVPTFGVAAGTTKAERVRLNKAAIQLLKNKNAEDMTDADRAVLAQYSGNGGTGDSLNEFYTDPRVAAAMWKSLVDLGLPPGAHVLEPSVATGVFIHTAPEGVKVTGVEMDPTSSSIATALHGDRHEIRNASLERFANTDDRQFDAVIGNPPFGLRGSLIKDDKPDLSTAESYFIDTALDKTKPGGIVALIVPTGVMDSKGGRAFRERMLRKGQFLGAMRMPNTAFEHAHTGVTTDVIYLRKRPDDVAGALMTVPQQTLRDLGIWDDAFLAGEYFTEGPGKGAILGTMTEGWRAKAGMGQDITVEGSMQGVPEAIAEFKPAESPAPDMDAVLQALAGDEKARDRAIGGASRRAYGQFKVGDTKVEDGVTYILQGDPPRWHRVEDVMASEVVAEAAPLAQEIDRLMSGEAIDRQALEAAIHAWVDKHGIPSRSDQLQAAAGHNKVLFRLIGAVKPDGTLSDVVTGATHRIENTFDSAAESLGVESGSFTPAQLAARWGRGDAEEALDHLYASTGYALNPDGTWSTMGDYLSGELWPKLDAARGALINEGTSPLDRAKLEAQVKALEEAIDPQSLDDVFVQVNQAWIPPHIVADFFTQRNKNGNGWQQNLEPVNIAYDGGVYTVTGGNTWGDTKLLDKYLNRTGVKKDEQATIEQWNRDFKEWLNASEYRDEVEDLYNRKFRGFRDKEYSNAKFAIPGLNDAGLKDYQYGGLRWALDRGKGIIAADVGLGKTARGLMLARMAKANGQAQRPMIVVPKSVLANWYAESQKWFPGSRVLTIGETYTKDKDGNIVGRQDTEAERKRKYHDMTQNDYDFILISQPAFNELDVDPETKNRYLDDDFWVQRGEKLGGAGDKRVKKVRESYEQSVAQRESGKRTDAIYFNDLGIDMLVMDEMHAYKNLYAARNRFGESPKFLGGQGLSNRAFDMSFKARWLREHAGGKNVYGLTATPTKNSPLEIYSMLSYIAPEAFERVGIRNAEEFLDRFAKFDRENILTTSGDIEESLVVSGFQNMDELREIMSKYIDRTTAADVGLKLPERDDRMHMVDMDAQQNAAYADLREQAIESSKKDATGDAHIFSIMDKMSKAAMDLELLDPGKYAGHVSPKYKEAAKHIVEGAKDGGQVVFADYLGAHDKIVNELVKGGIPRDQIGVINAQVAGSSSKRQKISDDFNAGKLKVVIGNTATMGEGINLQKGTTDVHHLDLPWEPASIQQRNGRGLRQGNINDAVRIHTYLSKGSFDGYKYQTVAAKKDWQDLLWTGGKEIENYNRSGAVGRDDMLIMLAADPEQAKAKFAANKEEALKRLAAERSQAAAGEYVRFQSMVRSLKGLKNKNTPAARKLSQNIERLRTNLHANKYFKAKDLLSGDSPGLVHPGTGEGVTIGTYIQPGEGSKGSADDHPMVVIGVNPLENKIKVRHYGVVGQSGWEIPISDFSGSTVFRKNDDAREVAEIKEKADADAKASVAAGTGIKSPKDAANLSPEMMRELYPTIQNQLKALARSFGGSFGYGDVAMINSEGKPVAHESYHFRDKVGDHDFMLPTAEHREKALQAWVDDEKAKEFKMDFRAATRGRGSRSGGGDYHFVAKYPGKWDQKTNRWTSIGNDLFDKHFEADAKQHLQNEVLTAARRARNVNDMFQAIKPLAQVAPYGETKVTIPKRALATLYARARRDGVLDEPLVHAKSHDNHILSSKVPLRDAIAAAAKTSGHRDLLSIIEMDRHAGDPGKQLAAIANHTATVGGSEGYRHKTKVSWSRDALEAMKHVIDKHPEIGDKTPEELDENRGGKFWAGIGYDNAVFKTNEPVRQSIERALGGENNG